MTRAVIAALILAGCGAPAVETDDRSGPKPVMRAWRGATPVLDGVISPGEWDDATTFRGGRGWVPTFTPTTDDRDLSLQGWVKHDWENLYFAFRVEDDVLYGIDTPRWLPDENPRAHELTREGFPWFGDEIEILIHSRPTGDEPDRLNAAGDGASWQMVCNLTKSRLGGVGGLEENRGPIRRRGDLSEVDHHRRHERGGETAAGREGLRDRVDDPSGSVPGGEARSFLESGAGGDPAGAEPRRRRPRPQGERNGQLRIVSSRRLVVGRAEDADATQ
jgi:hypothetical protein